MNVLIVDDNVDERESLATMCRIAGHDATTAPNGREALACILEKLPDVMILDLLMPEMDGPSLLEVLRSYLRMQSLPVVVLTAISDSPMVERARALKVNAILVKGKASPQDIMNAVEEARSRYPG